MKKYVTGAIIFGAMLGLLVLVAAYFPPTHNGGELTGGGKFMVVLIVASGIAFIVNLVMAVTAGRKKRKLPRRANSPTPKNAAQSTTYITVNGVTTRTDGKPITDVEIPYLIEQGYQHALEADRARFPEGDEKLQLEPEADDYSEISRQLCERFEELYDRSQKEPDIDKKIALLKQTIKAYKGAKQWHFKHSKSAKENFKIAYDDYFNSHCDHFSWIDDAESDLSFYTHTANDVIPWILDRAKSGFRQPDIYQAFPDDNKGNLRYAIDYLANQGVVVKSKKGSTYYITR